MAQSPEKNAGSSEILRYDLGWKAINDLLRSGRSLSGHERKCCFLNLGSTGSDRFADVSAAFDLDLLDDGRVLALSDWDFDGDVDFWVANRSGPQVRFLRNPFGDRSGKRNFAAFLPFEASPATATPLEQGSPSPRLETNGRPRPSAPAKDTSRSRASGSISDWLGTTASR